MPHAGALGASPTGPDRRGRGGRRRGRGGGLSGPVHRATGHPAGDGSRRCRDCGWAERDGDTLRCVGAAPLDAPGPVLPEDAVACAWFEPPLSCDPCGACCREAFDAVPVGPDDEHTARAHPERVQTHADGWRDLVRVPTPTGTRCNALTGDGCSAPFRCVIYADRPTACRELEPGSANCLLARRRVGLWPPGP